MTCSKLAVLNKAIQGDFFKSQKGKNRLINYGFLFNQGVVVANKVIHDTF